MGNRPPQVRESIWGKSEEPMIDSSHGNVTYFKWCLLEMQHRSGMDGRVRYIHHKRIEATSRGPAYNMCCFSLSKNPNK